MSAPNITSNDVKLKINLKLLALVALIAVVGIGSWVGVILASSPSPSPPASLLEKQLVVSNNPSIASSLLPSRAPSKALSNLPSRALSSSPSSPPSFTLSSPPSFASSSVRVFRRCRCRCCFSKFRRMEEIDAQIGAVLRIFSHCLLSSLFPCA